MDVVAAAITLLAAGATAFVAVADLRRADFVLANSAAVGVPRSWLTPLGLVKAAGAAGLVLGVAGVPGVGVAAAVGLTLFFVGAVVTHLRARNFELQFPVAFLAMAVASLALQVAAG